MWYAIGILFIVFLVIGLAHAHTNEPMPKRKEGESLREYSYRVNGMDDDESH